MRRFRIVRFEARPLAVPLTEPFVIATARVDVTPNVLVEIELEEEGSRAHATGLGEAATLHPVTRETADAVLGAFAIAAPPEVALTEPELLEWSSGAMRGTCARAGLDTALHDALGRLDGAPVWRRLGGGRPLPITSDITLSIGDPGRVTKVARRWALTGFRAFKVKVGRDIDEALRTLEALREAIPDATFRVDANASLTASEALSLVSSAEAMQLPVECWEQPCARLALEAMAEVTAVAKAPVLADESVSTLSDLERVVAMKAARGVNLKLVKSGGLGACLALGRAARAHGLSLMVGAMVESRLGIAAAVHLATALGGVEFPDLDTAFLLADDPFSGGYAAEGPILTAKDAPGLGVLCK